MFDNLFQFFEKLLTNFTWSRLTFTIVTLFILAASFYGYEQYTSHFKLSRISQEVNILERLVAISEKVNTKEKDVLIDKAFTNLVNTYNSHFLNEPAIFTSFYQPSWFNKTFFILLPWVLLSIFFYFSMREEKGKAIGGVVLVSTVVTFIGLHLPEFSEPWVLKWLYPWASFVIIIALIYFFDKRKKTKLSENSK